MFYFLKRIDHSRNLKTNFYFQIARRVICLIIPSLSHCPLFGEWDLLDGGTRLLFGLARRRFALVHVLRVRLIALAEAFELVATLDVCVADCVYRLTKLFCVGCHAGILVLAGPGHSGLAFLLHPFFEVVFFPIRRDDGNDRQHFLIARMVSEVVDLPNIRLVGLFLGGVPALGDMRVVTQLAGTGIHYPQFPHHFRFVFKWTGARRLRLGGLGEELDGHDGQDDEERNEALDTHRKPPEENVGAQPTNASEKVPEANGYYIFLLFRNA